MATASPGGDAVVEFDGGLSSRWTRDDGVGDRLGFLDHDRVTSGDRRHGGLHLLDEMHLERTGDAARRRPTRPGGVDKATVPPTAFSFTRRRLGAGRGAGLPVRRPAGGHHMSRNADDFALELRPVPQTFRLTSISKAFNGPKSQQI